jgi:hypothetical protein
MLERERKIAIRLLITGPGVRVPHNPQLVLNALIAKIVKILNIR